MIRSVSVGGSIARRTNPHNGGSRDRDPAKWRVTEKLLLREIQRIEAAKEKMSGLMGGMPLPPGMTMPF